MRSNNTFKPNLVRPTSSNCSKHTGSEGSPEHSVDATDGEHQQPTGNAAEHETQEETGLSSDSPNPLTTPMIKKSKVRRAPRSSEAPALRPSRKDKNMRFTIGRTEAGATTALKEELWDSLTAP